jgi:hypothetical protein
MLKQVFFVLVFFVASLHILLAQDSNLQFEQLKSMEGSWMVRSDKTMMIETWKYSNDTLIEGTVRMSDLDSNTLFSEKLAIRKIGNSIFYIAAVSNQNNGSEIPFELKSSNNSVFIFENPKHDFPQRIVYDISVKAKISAYIEGIVNGKLQRTDFNFEEVNH